MRNLKIGFVFTNYNNSKLSIQALESIATNANEITCVPVIVDNRSKDSERALLSNAEAKFPNAKFIFNEANLGYFDGLNTGITYLRKTHPDLDFIVIGNNDLIFPTPFFTAIDELKHKLTNYPVIAPDLIALEGVHQNPHVMTEISRIREYIWDLYFVYYPLARLMGQVSNWLKKYLERKDYTFHQQEGYIYQGYGACYILTPAFFKHFDDLWSPGFLMGEEFYLAKQLETIGEKMYYQPQITVMHHDHATVSTIPSKLLWTYTKQYHKIYRYFINPYRINMETGKTYQDYIRLKNEKVPNLH